MNRTKLVPLAVAVMMALPTILLATAGAVETVPIAPTVEWKNQVNLLQNLYARFNDGSTGQPDCSISQTAEPVTQSGFSGHRLAIDAGPVPRTINRNDCSFSAYDPGALTGTGQGTPNVRFAFRPGGEGGLAHGFNATLNTSLQYVHQGGIPNGVTLTVTLSTQRAVVSTLTLTGVDNVETFSGQFLLPENGYQFLPGDVLTLDLRGNAAVGANGLPSDGSSWSMRDYGPQGSRLEIRAKDAVKTATWVRNEKGETQELFRPVDANITSAARISGAFAVRSAFGYDDARGGVAPQFSITLNGEIVPFDQARVGYVDGVFSTTLSQQSAGRAVWTFPAGQWDYRGAKGGEYVLEVNKPYHQGPSFTGSGVEKKFFLSTQSVRVTPFDDEDPTTFPSPLENAAHDVLPEGRTTYLFLVNNTGAVNDTFRLDTRLVGGSPSTGWGASVGGPGVLDGMVSLAPGEQKIVTLTIAAPHGTRAGDNAIHQLEAVSTLDPSATPAPVTVVSTVNTAVTQGVDIVVVGKKTREITPDKAHIFDVFVWNRGSRSANLTLDLGDSNTQGWKTELLLGGLGVKQLQLSTVGAGDIARARLKVSGPAGIADAENIVTLTAKDASGVEKSTDLKFVLKPTSSVRLQILDTIQGQGHSVETFQGANNERDSAVDGTWVRVWVTNTGQQQDDFTLSLDTLSWSTGTAGLLSAPCEDGVFVNANGDHGEHDTDFKIFQRDALGNPSQRNTLALDAGETGELYVWRSIIRDAALCTDRDGNDMFGFVVTARGIRTNALAREGVVIKAEDRGQPAPVILLEGVARTKNYAEKATVDISQADKRLISGAVRVGENATYYIRVTNAASWGGYFANNQRVAPDVELTLGSWNSAEGWNVSMRQVTGELNETLNPFGTRVVLSNERANRDEAWIDHEIELRVTAPKAANATALANAQDQVTLLASIVGTPAKDNLAIKTVVSEFSDITLRPETVDRFTRAHPGEPGAYLVYVSNNGSASADVTLRARMDDSATTWQVDPAEQRFTLPAFTNRTVAVQVTPPANAVTGATGIVNVTVEFPEFPATPTKTLNRSLEITTEVTGRSTLLVEAPVREASVAPGGFANYTMTLKNTGGTQVQYNIVSTSIPNWTTTLGSTGGTLQAGESRPLVYVLQAPENVKDGTRFASVVRVNEVGNAANFDVVPVHVTIRGGKAIASVSAPVIEKRVDRGGLQSFEVSVKNLGTKGDFIPLEVRSLNPDWQVAVTNLRNEPINGVQVGPNELVRVNVTVKAPLLLPENALNKIELTAYSPDRTQSGRVTLSALVHDYGLQFEMTPTRIDAFAGVPSEFVLVLRNTGNDNDTLNVSANLIDLPEWSVDFSTQRVRLEKGQEAEIRATVRPPKSPLPTARNYDIKFFASSIGATEVNLSKNISKTGVVNVMDYRSLDVDGDGFLEIAVDANKRRDDGYEAFREPFPDGVQSVVIATAKLNNKATFFLDVPGERPYDGIADRWFDPESVFSFRITHAVDVTGDASPEYFLDTDRDREAKIDKAYDTVAQTFYDVIQVKAYGTEDIQYLIDTNADGRPDKFYDPATKKVTKTLPAGDAVKVGLDTNDDGRANKVYDTKSGNVQDAKLRNFSDFAAEFWYFFILFAALVILTTILVVRRYRN